MFHTAIIGAGPAGTGPLVWAARQGVLGDWLDQGVAVVDRRATIGGTVGQYGLNADSSAGTFLECLQGGDDALLAVLRDTPEARALAASDTAPPLQLVGRFLDRLGSVLAGELARNPRSQFFGGFQANSLQIARDGSVVAHLAASRGRHVSVCAASAVLALGGRPVPWREASVHAEIRLDRWADKVLPGDRLVTLGGAARAGRSLARRAQPLVVILGGSHMAFSSAWTLLGYAPGVRFGPAGVQVLYRTPPRVFYTSRAEALADGYDFTDVDVCHATGRVHRLGGLRGDGRQVWRRLRDRTDSPRDPRIVARAVSELSAQELAGLLDAANLIVTAFGYRLRTVPIRAADGRPIPLASSGPAVDAQSRLLTSEGTPLANVFGIGLGSGFTPWGAMGGEASFKGQQNSLWLYQNGLGELIRAGAQSCAEALNQPAPIRRQPHLQAAG